MSQMSYAVGAPNVTLFITMLFLTIVPMLTSDLTTTVSIDDITSHVSSAPPC